MKRPIKQIAIILIALSLSGCASITKEDTWDYIKRVGEGAWEHEHYKNCEFNRGSDACRDVNR